MKRHHADPDNAYIDGMKRLVSISQRNGQAAAPADARPAKDMGRHICLVCGHIWDVRSMPDGPRRCPACSSLRWNDDNIKRHRCKRCSHTWMSRLEQPLICPACRSKCWNRDTERYLCNGCGRTSGHAGHPRACPDCGSGDMAQCTVTYECGRCGYTSKAGSPPGRCPVCRMPMSGTSRERSAGKEEERTRISEAAIGILRSDVSDTSKIIRLGKIVDAVDAEILVRFANGEGPVSIAMSTDASLNRVMTAVVLYEEAAR